MAEGQGDIGAITLMKTNEGYSCRRWKERQGHRQRDKNTEWQCVCVCACVCEKRWSALAQTNQTQHDAIKVR